MEEGKRHIGELSIDAQTLYQRLRQAPVGDTVPYEELSSMIGRGVTRGGGYGALVTARRRALSLDHIVFATVAKVGLRRLDDAGIVDTGISSVRRIRRAARRAALTLTKVADYNSLPRAKQIAHNTHLSLFGVLSEITKPSQVARLEKRIANASGALPFMPSLEAFKE